jgi:hypothetical protein
MATTLDTKLDAMTAKPTQVVPPINLNPVGDPFENISPSQSEVPPSIDALAVTADAPTVISDVAEEPVVAGQKEASAKGIFKAIEKGAKAIEQKFSADEALARSKIIPKIENITPVEGGLLVRTATEAENEAITRVLPNYNGTGINLLRFGDTIGEDGAEFFARVKEANPGPIDAARRGTITINDLIASAQDAGLNDLVEKFAMRKPGQNLPLAEDVVAGILGLKNLHINMRELVDTARTSGSPEDSRKVLQALTLTRAYISGLSGVVSESGRTLGAVGGLAQKTGVPLTRAAEETDLLFRRFKETDDLKLFNEYFGFFETDAQRTAFVNGGWVDKLKKGVGKTYDIVQEGFINGLLSGPSTHMINTFGNAAFGTWQVGERYAAAGIGYMRTLGGYTGKERLTLSEANAYATASVTSFQDALRIAGASFVRGEPITGGLASKVELSGRKALDASNLGVQPDTPLGLGINFLGTIQRMAGRFLIAEDEFFRVVAYRQELAALTIREGDKAYFASKAAGDAEDVARLKGASVSASFANNPPESLMKDAMTHAKTSTFQTEMTGYLATAEKFSNLPVVKIVIPFFRTPTNITIEVLKRTPLNPSAYSAMLKSGPEADLALAKFGLGSAAMGTFAYMAYGADKPDFFITGMAAEERENKDRDARLGIQPYSFVFKNPDGSYESVSYARFEPLSALLAISADYAQFAKDTDLSDQGAFDTSRELATVGGLAIAQYMSTQPFVEGMAEFAQMFEEYKRSDDRNVVKLFLEKAIKGTTSTVIAATPGFGSFSATVERYVDPTGSETYVPSSVSADANEITSGFYRALNERKAKVPGLSKDVEPKLNIWGENVMQGRGSSLDLISPIKIISGKYNPVDVELRRLDIGLDTPPKNIVTNVPLTAKQYNKWIRIANLLDESGQLPGDNGYDESTTLLNSLSEIIKSEDYKSQSIEEQQNQIKQAFSHSYGEAKKMIIYELKLTNPEFRSRLKAANSKMYESLDSMQE